MARPRKPIQHGTIGGHRAHFRRGEPMCEPCRDANRRYHGQEPFRPVQCGTRSGYMAHIDRGENACDDCRTAQNDYARKRRHAGIPADDSRHGTVNAYRNYSCRCEPCKAAGAADNRRQAEARKQRGAA